MLVLRIEAMEDEEGTRQQHHSNSITVRIRTTTTPSYQCNNDESKQVVYFCFN